MSSWSQLKLTFLAAAAGATVVVAGISAVYVISAQIRSNGGRKKKNASKYDFCSFCFLFLQIFASFFG